MSAITLADLNQYKARGEKIAVLTSYDASFTRLIEQAGVEVILVGDSLGMVIQGHASTLPVTMDDMVYHCRSVARALRRAFLIADMPFMSYASPQQALDNAGRLMQEGLAHMVKLEGGGAQLDSVELLTRHAIPVCAHLGLTPQSVHQLGGFRVQGRDAEAARTILDDALALQQAGARLLVLECVPAELGRAVSRELTIPVIGIGAGADCDGQVLVVYDALGIGAHAPRFVRDFLAGGGSIAAALERYVAAVKSGDFPAPEECYT